MDSLKITQLQRCDLLANQVRGAFLAADDDGELVGRISIRFALNEYLATRGGHIGYGVIPQHRRKGYATAMLREAVLVACDEGVNPLLLTCNDDNVGSATVIERYGGALESVVVDDDGVTFRRYWLSSSSAAARHPNNGESDGPSPAALG